MASCSGITLMARELVEGVREQLGIIQIALTQAFVGQPRVVMSLVQECDIETRSCQLHFTIESPWRPYRSP